MKKLAKIGRNGMEIKGFLELSGKKVGNGKKRLRKPYFWISIKCDLMDNLKINEESD